MTDLHTAAQQRYELSVLPSADQVLIAQNFAINELQKFTKKNVTRDAQSWVNKIAEFSLFMAIGVFSIWFLKLGKQQDIFGPMFTFVTFGWLIVSIAMVLALRV